MWAYHSGILRKHRKGFHRDRDDEFLYIPGQRGFGLWNRRRFRGIWLVGHHYDMGCAGYPWIDRLFCRFKKMEGFQARIKSS